MLLQLPATKFTGTPEAVAPRLQSLVDRTGVQELMVTATTFGVATRIQTLRDVQQMGLVTAQR